jgi:hypothetical protein
MTITTIITTSDRAVDLNEHKDKDDMINLINSRSLSIPFLPNSTIGATFARTLFIE